MKAITLLISMACIQVAMAYNDSPYEPVHDFIVDGIYYTITDKENKYVEVACGNTESIPPCVSCGPMNYLSMWWGNCYEGDIEIPLQVTYENTEYKVVGIGPAAFTRCPKLKSVVVPEGITYIDDYGFFFCKNLESINIPHSVETIGKSAFYDCDDLKTISLNGHITSIPDECFCSIFRNGESRNPKQHFILTDYEAVEEIGAKAFSYGNIENFDFSKTAIKSIVDVGDNLFTNSSIEEITLPIYWNDADYGSLITNIGGEDYPTTLQRLILRRLTPPQVNPQDVDIDEEFYDQVTLLVPPQSIEAYRDSEFWSKFKAIDEAGVSPNHLDENNSETIWYNLDGTPASRQPSKGIYIRKSGSQTEKVIL